MCRTRSRGPAAADPPLSMRFAFGSVRTNPDACGAETAAFGPFVALGSGFAPVLRRAWGPGLAADAVGGRSAASVGRRSTRPSPARTIGSAVARGLAEATTSSPCGSLTGSSAATVGCSLHVGAGGSIRAGATAGSAGCEAATAGGGCDGCAGSSTRWTGGAGCGCTGGGDAAGAGAGVGATTLGRAGRNASGSTYPSSSAVRRTPRCTCGSRVITSELSPTTPTRAPSATSSPRPTEIEPSCNNVMEYPSAVRIVSARPPPGTDPTKDTLPATGARTDSPTAPPTSIPRCWPAAYGSDPKTKGRSTGPSIGHVHACAPPGNSSANSVLETTASRRIVEPPCCRRGERPSVERSSGFRRCQR